MGHSEGGIVQKVAPSAQRSDPGGPTAGNLVSNTKTGNFLFLVFSTCKNKVGKTIRCKGYCCSERQGM